MKTVSTLRVVGDDDATVLPTLSAELQLAFADVAELAREGLLAMSVAVGLRVMNEMMDAEVTDQVGLKHAKLPDRTASRHTAAPGSVVLGGRRLPVTRPRARTIDGAEVQLATYATFSNDDLLNQVVMERMLAGVATRRHRAVAEPVGDKVTATSLSTSRSAVSRRFKTATTKALDELMARDLGELQAAAMMIDGVFFAGQCCVVALCSRRRRWECKALTSPLTMPDGQRTRTVISACRRDPAAATRRASGQRMGGSGDRGHLGSVKVIRPAGARP